MKNRFSTLDVFAIVQDLRALEGMRVVNIYDVEKKTYLLKLHRLDEKAVLLIESGVRVHTTTQATTKQLFPSSFAMKLRKHIRQKHLDSVLQLGVDRVIDFRFGTGDAAVHLIVELYDRGNLVLTDASMTILNILRPRTDADTDVRFAVRETYKSDVLRSAEKLLDAEELHAILVAGKKGESVKRALAAHTQYGPALIEHALVVNGFPRNAQMQVHVSEADASRVSLALALAQSLYDSVRASPSAGYIVSTVETGVAGEMVETYQEFNPVEFRQYLDMGMQCKKFDTFNGAVDEFFSKRESQRDAHRLLTQERDALKKLENVKKDHVQRLAGLEIAQGESRRFAELIEGNHELVDRAIRVVRSAIANQLAWFDIQQMVNAGKDRGDSAASAIAQLDLDNNAMVLSLSDPYEEDEPPALVRIHLNLGAHQNARRYFDDRRAASEKHAKTALASEKALKSAQIKTMNAIKQVKVRTNIMRNRRAMWFEKFHWFVSSDGLLVIAGRDAHQNEYIVKRHLRDGDLYVHADMRGASSVVIKGRKGGTSASALPKTLHEAAAMAVCQSAAWDARVVAGAWWVTHSQVSRTAPTGEFLTPGSFMIRGKKNFLPPAQLVMGFGFVFKLDEESIERRRGEKNSETGERGEELQEGGEGDEEVAISESSADEEHDEHGTDKEQFPDVQVSACEGIAIAQVGVSHLGRDDGGEANYTILQLGPARKVPTQREKENARQDAIPDPGEKGEDDEGGKSVTRVVTKRQKHKEQKRNKGKYRDQDDEERELRLQLLGSTGKKTTTSGGNKANKGTREETRPRQEEGQGGGHKREKDESSAARHMEDEVDDEVTPNEDALLESVTCSPVEADGLLFAVPVCAPYQAMSAFKYKVKLTPGTTKRGKAAKTAIDIFQKDRNATTIERDLLKAAMQEQDVGRSIPGKVKLSIPQLSTKLKK